MTEWRYLDLADFALIAEAVLGVPAEQLLRMARLDLAESALAETQFIAWVGDRVRRD